VRHSGKQRAEQKRREEEEKRRKRGEDARGLQFVEWKQLRRQRHAFG
jgi:hypothetical protein